MPRNVQPGTPDRSPRYIFPRGPRRSLGMAAIGGAVLAVVIVASYFAGLKRVSSPGPVASSHSAIEARCEQCHDVGKGVADTRCERCHDPSGADRFSQQGHVLFGSGNPHKAAAAADMSCVACHTDHRGRASEVKSVDDRDCGQCHRFSALKGHPEFAAVRAQISTGAGLAFGHQRHIVEAAKQLGKRCEACHEPTADLVGLSAEQAGAAPPTQTPAERGRITLSRMKHKDPWVLYNAQRLRRMIDPAGIGSEAAALRGQIAYLTQQTGDQSLSNVAVADLQRWQTTLEQEVVSIDKRLAS